VHHRRFFAPVVAARQRHRALALEAETAANLTSEPVELAAGI